MNDILSERLESLEIRIAYQDESIETLNQTITAQWAEIDALKRAIARLTDQVQDAEARTGSLSQPEPPPPHY